MTPLEKLHQVVARASNHVSHLSDEGREALERKARAAMSKEKVQIRAEKKK